MFFLRTHFAAVGERWRLLTSTGHYVISLIQRKWGQHQLMRGSNPVAAAAMANRHGMTYSTTQVTSAPDINLQTTAAPHTHREKEPLNGKKNFSSRGGGGSGSGGLSRSCANWILCRNYSKSGHYADGGAQSLQLSGGEDTNQNSHRYSKHKAKTTITTCCSSV